MNIIWENASGEIKITTLIDDVEKIEDSAAHLKANDPILVDFQAVAFNQILPETREFRGAWSFDNGVYIDMDKARNITRDIIREKRAPILAKLDVDYMRAVESKRSLVAETVVVQKNIWRDATDDSQIATAESPQDLIDILNAMF